MIVQQTKTGRKFGDKIEPKTGTAKVGSATVHWEEFDHWVGPTDAGQSGEYVRATRINQFGRMEHP